MKTPKEWASLIQYELADHNSLTQEFMLLVKLVEQIQNDALGITPENE